MPSCHETTVAPYFAVPVRSKVAPRLLCTKAPNCAALLTPSAHVRAMEQLAVGAASSGRVRVTSCVTLPRDSPSTVVVTSTVSAAVRAFGKFAPAEVGMV